MVFLLNISNNERFITVVKVQPGLATTHAKFLTHVLDLLSHALEAHRPHRHSEAPSSLLRAIKLWYIVAALLHSQGSREKQRERFASVEREGATLILSVTDGVHQSSIDMAQGPNLQNRLTRAFAREPCQHLATRVGCQWQHVVFWRKRARPAMRRDGSG